MPIVNGEGGHGGGDALLLSDLFNGPGEDPLGRPSGYLDGLRSVSVGIAGNRSLESDHCPSASRTSTSASTSAAPPDARAPRT